MIGLVDVLVALAWTFGANGFLVERPPGGGDPWPAGWLAPVAEEARIVFHDREDWAMAFYLPPAPMPEGAAEGAAGAQAPRLFLYAPYYLAPDGLVAPGQMPVDVAEYYFHALLELALDLEPAGSARGAWGERRAAELMAEVPAAQRRAAYLSALADFGAHVLSIANEIDRAARRQRAAGKDLCRLVGSPASLFGLWARSFSAAPYRGRYLLPAAEDGSSPGEATSRRILERRDKDAFARSVLGVDWSGDPARDFGWLCPEVREKPS